MKVNKQISDLWWLIDSAQRLNEIIKLVWFPWSVGMNNTQPVPVLEIQNSNIYVCVHIMYIYV